LGDQLWGVYHKGVVVIKGTKKEIEEFALKLKGMADDVAKKYLDDLAESLRFGKFSLASSLRLLEEAANEALRLWPNALKRPGAVAILEGRIGGKVRQIIKYSTGGQGLKIADLFKKYHPLVKEWIEQLPKEIRFKGTRGKCGENFTISEWLYEIEKSKGIKQGALTLEQARAEMEGVVSKAKSIQNKKLPNIVQGLDKKACQYCNPLLKHFNIKEVL
jgi:YwqJ-like deaminase